MEFFNKHKIIVILIVIVLAFVVYSFFFAGEEEELLDVTTAENAVSAADQGLIVLLQQLQGLKLEESLFSSDIFMSLTDFGQDIAPQPVGRDNPFAPLGQ